MSEDVYMLALVIVFYESESSRSIVHVFILIKTCQHNVVFNSMHHYFEFIFFNEIPVLWISYSSSMQYLKKNQIQCKNIRI